MRASDFESSLDPDNIGFEEKAYGGNSDTEEDVELYGFTITDDDDEKDDLFDDEEDEEDEEELVEEGVF